MAWILEEIVNEVLDEANGEPSERLAGYLLMTSQVMRWAATGEIADLPEEFMDKVLELEAPREETPEDVAMIAHQ